MSAIWGIIDLAGREISIEDAHKMDIPYAQKKIDRVDRLYKDNCYMCCGIQYVTREAREESFPYGTEDTSLLVADVILDNRRQLLDEFDISIEDSQQDGTDGKILYQCMMKDTEKALDRMLGAYTFAIYDVQKAEVKLVSDALGNRSVYYFYQNGRFFFSTLLESLLVCKKEKKLNERWLSDYFGLNSLQFVTESTETLWENIYRVEAGEVVTCNRDGIKKYSYWNPFSIKTLNHLSDEEYKEKVLSVFRECVQSTIRDDADIAILLSGGLDSNAVAAFALPELKRRGKKLYSYTSVPGNSMSSENMKSYYIKNESPYIMELEKKNDNLVADYIDTSEGDVWEENRKLFEVFEMPYKSVANIPWMYRAYKKAYENGCRIILSGQYGNITISYGDFFVLFNTLFRHGKIMRLIKEINAFSKKYRCSRKKILYELLFGQYIPTGKEGCLLNHELQKKYHLQKRLNKLSLGKKNNILVFNKMKRYMYDKVALRQIGESEIKMSLETGIIPRDPTRDKRLIELMLSMPQEQFVKKGRSRRLVRVYMKDIIPDMILNDDFHRGEQGSGAVENLRIHWEQIYFQAGKFFASEAARKYLNLTYIKKQMESAEDLLKEENEFEMVKILYSSLACEYLEKLNG